MAHNIKYSFSFTGASALIPETVVVAEEFTKYDNWEIVHKSLANGNLLNKIKHATFKRQLQEIEKRLSSLSSNQLNLLVNGDLEDVKAMILLSLVKVYPLIHDFIIEVIRNKYQLFDNVLTETDYNKFIYNKSLTHPELEKLSETTSKKVKQRVFTLLEQVSIINSTKNGIVLKPILSSKVIDAIVEDNSALLKTFLFSNEEIKTLMHKPKHA